uniref:Uncharacterized protein n=1 Tax=Avena sativa TaxID=4498 RepID=A0ACD5TSI7_AVESA
MRRKGWSDLPPDLLREIAGRLHVAADFVIFHAVCHPWRSSRDQLSGTTATATQLLPWFVAPTVKHGHASPLKARCIFSNSIYLMLPRPYTRQRHWVYGADGATVGYLTVKRLLPTLHDPITGAVTDLPRFPSYFDYPWEENPCGIVAGDGTTFIYGTSHDSKGGTTSFRAVLLRPGDTKWALVDRTYETTNGKQIEFCAWSLAGRFLVSVESSRWRIVIGDDDGKDDDVVVPRPCIGLDQPDGSRQERSNYILESHGELLWASVQLCYSDHPADPCRKTFLVSVHALEEATVPEKARWVGKESHCLADRVLFLGSPNSFAVDASLLGGGQGGCAYFVYQDSVAGTPKNFGLFRYSFLDGKTECIQRLPEEWKEKKCMWFIPQPTVAPLQIIRRKLQSQKVKKHQKAAPVIASPSGTFHIERHYEHSFSVLVHDIPPKVKNPQLQLFFGKHGKVSSTEIIYSKDANTSEGIVKMATMHAHEEDAIAALEGLDFEGCSLEVILASDPQRQRWRWRNAA